MDKQLERALEIVTQAALERRRCPQNGCEGLGMQDIAMLARIGKLRIEIYAHNYRRVTLLEGEHKGKSTAAHPTGLKPWKVIDSTGTRTTRGFQQPAAAVTLPRFMCLENKEAE